MTQKIVYSVLIPAYNAEKTIKTLLLELDKLDNKPSEVIVVDDGSYDLTHSIAQKHGSIVESLPVNSGKGKALKKGFEIFLDKLNTGTLICMDADLQHSPTSIDEFLNKSELVGESVIIGKRDINLKNMPLLRFLSNKITSFILGKLSGLQIPDSQCGYRLIPRNILMKFNCSENGFQLESEFILRCAEQKIPIEFVEIPTIYAKNGSHIRHVSDTYKFVRLVLKEMFRR